MPNISKEKLSNDIEEIFKDADLSKLSSKMIRLKLQERYGIDLLHRKSEIEEIAMNLIEKYTNNKTINNPMEKPSNNQHSEKPKNNKRKHESDDDDDEDKDSDIEKPDEDSSGDEISDSEINTEKLNGTGPTKRMKVEKLSNTEYSDEDEVTPNDEDLARKLQEEEEALGGRRTRHGRKKDPVKKKKSQKKGAPRKNSYTEECLLSPELSALLGHNKLRRSDVVKRMWEIVKERNLFFPKNKQYMICDDDMFSIFGKKKVRLFGMMKTLTNHIYKAEEVI